MKYNQEYIAENLHENLIRYFKNKNESIKITIEGVGVHWNCNLALRDRRCKIHCFEHRNYDVIEAEYLISFEQLGKNIAWGRTHDLAETIYSSKDWIQGKDIESLYQKYEFVDWYKRKIKFIEQELLTKEPQLVKTERSLISPWGSGLYDYSIDFNNRSCKLSGYGKDEPISFRFQWDKCDLFEVGQDDLALLAKAIKKWLIDEIKPSELATQFSWIEVGDLAIYYEKGEGIEGEFIQSWNRIETFYKEINENFTPKVLHLIKELRVRGYDQKLRAGQSLYNFILSRSKRHGLNQEQSSLAITFGFDKDEMKVTDKANNSLFVGKVEYSDELGELLNQLAKEDID